MAESDFISGIRNSMRDTILQIKNMSIRKILLQLFQLGMIVGSALCIWQILMILSQSESPVVVVLTGSMEPAYQRGDILFVTNYDEVIFCFVFPIKIGDVLVFKIEGQEIPIVHRALNIEQKGDKDDFYLLTKGDNNVPDDRGLYNYKKGQFWLHKGDVQGKIRAYLPYIGYVTILLNDNPTLKYFVIGIMGFFVLIAKDPNN